MNQEEYWNRVLAAKKEQRSRESEMRRMAQERRYEIARIPRGFWGVSIDAIPDFEYKRKIKSWTKKFIDHVRRREPFPGLYLHGPLGSGKSAIAARLLAILTDSGIPGLWMDYSEIVDIATNDPIVNDGTNQGLWDYANSARIVVIDDVGRGIAENAFTQLQTRRVEELLRSRWSQGLATIVTSNGTLDSLREADLDSLASILDESCYDIEIKGANFRGWKAKRKEPL